MSEIFLDVSEMERKTKQLSALLSIEPAEAVRREFASTIKTLTRYTYPPSKAAGEKAVERDIRKIFTTPPDLFKSGSHIPTLDAALKASEWDKATAIIRKLKKYQTLQVADSVDPNVHAKYRTRRGDVRRKQPTVVLIKNPERLKSYINSVKARVGSAKASWLAAARKFGASGLAAFVTRHGSSEGSAADTILDGTGYVEAVSYSVAASDIDKRANVVDRALANTDAALTIRLQKTLEKMAKQF